MSVDEFQKILATESSEPEPSNATEMHNEGRLDVVYSRREPDPSPHGQEPNPSIGPEICSKKIHSNLQPNLKLTYLLPSGKVGGMYQKAFVSLAGIISYHRLFKPYQAYLANLIVSKFLKR